ncbi:hypothetical protein [Hymenobacter ruricola]|uniref:Uncharacterized protein n=1 Tax=Hymenobacter ruricola TaxID=2791023 RepID=A0ABS0HZQ3_9BACT|nr:hypothetical protein [Hymenobacter ruricola]MBF9220171.1 hypothetical protein [Hymenobacter ruricola]
MSQHNANPLQLLAVNFPTRVNVTATDADNQAGWLHYNQMVFERIRNDYQPELQSVMSQGIDSRTNNPNYAYDNSASAPDHQVDYTIIIWRYDGNHNPHNTFGLEFADGSGGGFATVGFGILSTGISPALTTGQVFPSQYNGFTQCIGVRGMDKAIFTHELAHTLYSAPHVYGANNVVGKHLYGSVGYGMIGGPMLNCANGWERWYLNRITLQASGVPADVFSANTLSPGGLYTLRDFISTGDVVRIRLPNSRAADGTAQYLWLENHQGTSVWDNAAWVLDGQSPPQPFPAPPRGLVAYVEDLHVLQSAPNPPGGSIEAGGLRILPSGGLIDADHNGQTSTFNNHFWGNVVHDFVRRRANPTGPMSGQNSPIDDRNGDRVIDHAEFTNSSSGQPHDHNEGFVFMSFDHANLDGLLGTFMTYNQVGQKLGLDRNPTIFPSQVFDPNTQQLSPIHLSGLSVEIVGISGGDITVRVRFDDVAVAQNTRWTGNVALHPVPNSAYAAVVQPNVVLTINQSGTPNRTTPIGSTGTKADFINPTRLTINTGAEVLLKDATLLIHDRSTAPYTWTTTRFCASPTTPTSKWTTSRC